MKKLIQVALLAGALTACSSEPAEEATEEPVVEETAAASELAGSYEVTQADGTKTTTVINADGTYTDTDADGTAVSGTVAVVDGKECFTPAAAADADAEATATCYTSTEPDADGVFTATPDEGDPLTVKKTA